MQKHLNNLKKTSQASRCLDPGEVHLAFSENIIDEQSGSNDTMLHDAELVVSRQPALRGSGMQKVQRVFNPELKHLLDVIVFPTRGVSHWLRECRNGDYDGDTFWVTWDPAVVDLIFLYAGALMAAPFMRNCSLCHGNDALIGNGSVQRECIPVVYFDRMAQKTAAHLVMVKGRAHYFDDMKAASSSRSSNLDPKRFWAGKIRR
ncbi:hypothetical protein GJ744_003412 [Endocarpon pusillum]|uniref:RNA-dependent RNA polymerase n=1 Tax=Endocarpon pusillum TaxID=364733 RepID=A0A8H7DY61_9EURO|nr:hypothetical protein GJ744_003412 [Endocarpon pusillum]